MRGKCLHIDLDPAGIQVDGSVSQLSGGTLHLRTYISLRHIQLIYDRTSILSPVMGIATLNNKLQIVDANSDICELFGRPLPQLRGRKLQTWLDADEAARLNWKLNKLIKNSTKFVTVDIGLSEPHRARVIIRIVACLGWTVEQRAGTIPRVITMMRPHVNTEPGSRNCALPLSELDLKIIEGVAAGASTKHLSTALYLSKQGVEYHVSSMLRKLAVPNRAALVAKAYELGILDARYWPPRLRTDGSGDESGAHSSWR